MIFKHFDWLSDYSKSEALFTSRLFFNMAAENRFVLISFIEGILKDNAITQNTKMQQKSGYKLLILTIIIY